MLRLEEAERWVCARPSVGSSGSPFRGPIRLSLFRREGGDWGLLCTGKVAACSTGITQALLINSR